MLQICLSASYNSSPQKAPVSPIQDRGLPRFPSSRPRNQKVHPGNLPSVPSSLNSSTETCGSVSPGASTSTSSSVQLNDSSQTRELPSTPEPPKSASYTNQRHSENTKEREVGGGTKFLSHSNNSPTSKQGVRGGVNIPPLRVAPGGGTPFTRQSPLGVGVAGPKLSGRPPLTRGGGIAGREEPPSFLHKFAPPSHIPPTIAIPGRPKEIVPKSWQMVGGGQSMETDTLQLQGVPLRRRSFTAPAELKPKKKPGEEVGDMCSWGLHCSVSHPQPFRLLWNRPILESTTMSLLNRRYIHIHNV